MQLNNEICSGFEAPRQLTLTRKRSLPRCPAKKMSVWIRCGWHEAAVVTGRGIFLIPSARIRRLVDEHRRVVDRPCAWPEFERLDVPRSVERDRNDERSEQVRSV